MKSKQLREMEIPELLLKEREVGERFFQNRMKHSLGQLDKSHQLKHDRRLLARIQTVIAEKRA
ncbi:MAG: 50S ribosomal protein L29 [Deltaproteobacteria bacterium RIFOXYA12_FULL_61_11]|nr:MAG: 50S ribosomal protein L29 [Deltaproteobacteria bacterium RIFOXYA12_FULL_61_11]